MDEYYKKSKTRMSGVEAMEEVSKTPRIRRFSFKFKWWKIQIIFSTVTIK